MYKSSSKHKRRNEDSSDWQLDPSSQRYYRYYVDANGNTHYVWYDETVAESSHAGIPRDTEAAAMEDITEGMENLSHDPYETQQDESYTVTGSSRSKSKSSKSKGKGKHKEHRHGDDEQDAYYPQGQESYSEYAQDDAHPDAYQASGASYSQGSTADVGQDYTSTSQTYYQQPAQDTAYSDSSGYHQHDQESQDYGDENDPEVQAAMAASRQYNTGYYTTAGESSTQDAPYYDPYEYDAEGPATPRQGEDPGTSTMMDQMEECGELDPRYRVQPSNMFQPGAIFKVYWAEPEGSSKEHRGTVSTQHEFQNKFGTKFYFGFRRFVVVANDQGHSTCVPVLTYGGKACKKKGVKPDKHGIIHERNHKARSVDREPKLGFPPVRVEITEEGERLARESRVNYSKLVTVEHNVRVFFIGNIYYPDFEIVSDAVNKCWDAKVHHKKKHKR